MRHVGWLALLLPGPCWLAGLSLAAAPELRSQVLRDDPRLQAPVTLQHRLVTLEEGLRTIARTTGVTLRVAPGLGSENVCLLVRDRPAAEVLEVLADTLGYRWAVEKVGAARPRYQLFQARESAASEAAARQRRREEALSSLQQACRSRSGPNVTSVPELDQEIAGFDAIFRDPVRPDQERESARWVSSLLRFWGRQQALSVLMAARSLPQSRARLLHDPAVRFTWPDNNGLEAMPNWMRDAVVRCWREAPKGLGTAPAPPRQVDFVLWFGWGDRKASLRLAHGVLPLPEAMQRTASFYSVGVDLPPPPAPALEAGDPRLQAEVQAALPAKVPRYEEVASYFPDRLLVDLLASLHEQQPQLGFIGDAWHRPLPVETLGQRGPLLAVLNRAAAASGSRLRWDPRGYVGIRSLTVAEDRGRSVPASLLRELGQRVQACRGLLVADYLWLVTRLTDDQLEFSFPTPPQASSLLAFPDGKLDHGLSTFRHDLRLLASLSEEQWAALRAGKQPSGRELLPAQRQSLRRAFNEGAFLLPQENGTVRFWTDPDVAALQLWLEMPSDQHPPALVLTYLDPVFLSLRMAGIGLGTGPVGGAVGGGARGLARAGPRTARGMTRCLRAAAAARVNRAGSGRPRSRSLRPA
jgi:hypothetical protein